jgi:hypothetical protein
MDSTNVTSPIPNPPAKRRRRNRDMKVRRRAMRLGNLADLTDLRYRPILADVALVGLLLENAYAAIQKRESLLNESGEICSSVDTIRRLADSYAGLLKLIGLTPLSVTDPKASLDAAFERINSMRKVRGAGEEGIAQDSGG